jgi:hypothetical protein
MSWPRGRLLIRLPSELREPAGLVWPLWLGVDEGVVGLFEFFLTFDAPAPAVCDESCECHQEGQPSQAA